MSIPDNKGVREENWMEPYGKFYPEKMQEIVDQLKADRGMPSFDEFSRAMERIRDRHGLEIGKQWSSGDHDGSAIAWSDEDLP